MRRFPVIPNGKEIIKEMEVELRAEALDFGGQIVPSLGVIKIVEHIMKPHQCAAEQGEGRKGALERAKELI